jgi:ubiquinone biosynthesis monooxygenase Coq7
MDESEALLRYYSAVMDTRTYSLIDRLICGFDQGLRTLYGRPPVTDRANPANDIEEAPLSERERRTAGRLMRVNHSGEVCAQALYQGQALTAQLHSVQAQMEQAAAEENDHLEWCAQRIAELGEHPSLLNPLWYLGSLTIGALAGAAGDRWSLGFVAETERQVVHHLEEHLRRFPPLDHKSKTILAQMCEDENHHATTALAAGGRELPALVRRVMTLTARIMTRSSYSI